MKPPSGVSWCLITAKLPPERCGVGDYTWRLAHQLAQTAAVTIVSSTQGHQESDVVHVRAISGWGLRGMIELWRTVKCVNPQMLNLQYVPFLYHWTGVNIWLPFAALCFRCAGYRVVLTVHEPYVPLNRWVWVIPGLLQRLTLGLLISTSTHVVVSITGWTAKFKRQYPWASARISWLPAGSNIPALTDPAPQHCIRQELGIHADHIVLGAFSPLGSGKNPDWIWATWEALRDDPRLTLLIIGPTRDEFAAVVPRVLGDVTGRFICTGYVPPELASSWLIAADLILAPFSDGMSARRTSAITALEQGVPLITTHGENTDPLFEDGSVLLVRSQDREGFITAARSIVADQERRRRLGRDGRLLWSRFFSWPAIRARLEENIEGTDSAGACSIAVD